MPSLPTARRRWRRGGLLLLVLILIGLAWLSGVARLVSLPMLAEHHRALRAAVAMHPWAAGALYLLAYVAVVALSLPGGAIMTLAGGLLFGATLGTLLAASAATLGAAIVFLLARSAIAPFLAIPSGRFAERLRAGLDRHGFFYLLGLRLIPLIPFWTLNLVPALFGMRFAPFLAATALGILPATAIFAALGAGVGEVLAAGEEAIPPLSLLSPPFLWPLIGLAALAFAAALIRGRWKQTAAQQQCEGRGSDGHGP